MLLSKTKTLLPARPSSPPLHHLLLLAAARIDAFSYLPADARSRIDLAFPHSRLFASLCFPARFAPPKAPSEASQSPLLVSVDVAPDPSPRLCNKETTKKKKKKKVLDATDVLPHADHVDIWESFGALGVEKQTVERIVDLQHSSLLVLRQKILLLLREEFTPVQVRKLVTESYCRPFVEASYEKVLSVIHVLKTRDLTGKDAGRTLTRNPSLLVSSIKNLESKLKFFEDLKMGKEALKRIISWPRRPFSIVNSTVESLQKRVAFLEGIGINREELHIVIHKYPHVLNLSVEANLNPTVKFLEAKGINKYAICKLVRIRPEVLGLSEKNLTKKIELLQQLGFKFQSGAGAGFRAFTWLCTYRHDQILERFDFLKSHGFSHDEVSRMAQLQPGILILRQEYLKQKLDYLVNVLNRNIQEIVTFPACLTYSLEKRIIPRFNVLEEKGLLEGEIRLNAALSTTDNEFYGNFLNRIQRRKKRRNYDEAQGMNDLSFF